MRTAGMEEANRKDELEIAPATDASMDRIGPVHGLSDAKAKAVEMLVAGIRPGVVAKRMENSRETLGAGGQEPGLSSACAALEDGAARLPSGSGLDLGRQVPRRG